MVWATLFWIFAKQKKQKKPKWPESHFVMVWATFLRIPIDFHEIPSMPKPLQNTIEMKQKSENEKIN